MSSVWRRTASRMLITGYIVTLRNESGMTTREVKFGINDYLGAEVSQLGGTRQWIMCLYHGTTMIERKIKPSEGAARQAAKKWMKMKLSNLRGQYEQAERNVIADCLARGYKLEGCAL